MNSYSLVIVISRDKNLGLRVKYPLFLSDLNESLIFSSFWENLGY
jgi:hypothetical protein